LNIRVLSEDDRAAVRKTIADVETLHQEMARANTPGQERVAQALKSVAAALSPLLETKVDDEWRAGDDARTWCRLARQPPPDPTSLSAYLGTLACGDDTGKAFTAQRLITRILRHRPDAFFEAFKSCPAFARIPTELKSQLERAAQADKEKAAKLKPETPAKKEQSAAPEVPEICIDKPATAGANKPLP
jgi:hypothetical protein